MISCWLHKYIDSSCWLIKWWRGLWGILPLSVRGGKCIMVSAIPKWCNFFTIIRLVISKFFAPFLELGGVMFRNPIRISFSNVWQLRRLPEWVWSSFIISFLGFWFYLGGLRAFGRFSTAPSSIWGWISVKCYLLHFLANPECLFYIGEPFPVGPT